MLYRTTTDNQPHLGIDELVDGLHARQPVVVVRAARAANERYAAAT